MFARGRILAAAVAAVAVALAALENIPVAAVGAATLVYGVSSPMTTLHRTVVLALVAALLFAHANEPSSYSAPIAFAALYI